MGKREMLTGHETSLRPTPTDEAILQSKNLGPSLKPPPWATRTDVHPVAYFTDTDRPVYNREPITVEGPAELEPDTSTRGRRTLDSAWGDE